MLPQKIKMTLKKFLHVNIMTLMKRIALKYLTKINHYPYSILMHVLLIEILNDLQHLLSSTKTVFDIMAVSETRITKQAFLLNNLNLNNYSVEFTPKEASAGGTILFIANHLLCKHRNDLNIYKRMNWNLLLLKLLTQESQILLWQSFTDICLQILLTFIVIT